MSKQNKNRPQSREPQNSTFTIPSTSRRDFVVALGGAAILGPMFGCGSGGSNNSDASSTPASGVKSGLAAAVAAESSLVLFVPGYTGATWLGELLPDIPDLKARYFSTQIAYLSDPMRPEQREVLNMNDVLDESGNPLFDSDRAVIACNADAVANVLRDELNRSPQRGVTIVSHGKGGLDVLHALVTLDNEADLKYRLPKAEREAHEVTPGEPVNRDVWSVITGWVALNSNFFETAHPVIGAEGSCDAEDPGQPGIDETETIELEDDCDSRYGGFEVFDGEKFEDRQQYMADHQEAIMAMTVCVPTMSAYATYLPDDANAAPLDVINKRIQTESDVLELCGGNDGLVPARAAQLPGAMIETKLPEDPGQGRAGVDFLAPAVETPTPGFWSDAFRNEQTAAYIDEIEDRSMDIVPFADAGPDQTVECEGHDGTEVTLDGSASSSDYTDIVDYTWFENGEEIATGVSPVLTFELGVHELTLRVSDHCGRTHEDVVIITVEDTTPPEISLELNIPRVWPPNHKMVQVATGISASDICDPEPSLSVEVTSNEDVNGLGDGNTEPDWLVEENPDGTYNVSVRVERSGTGEGRLYTITATAEDASGNVATESAEVQIPHDQR
jgi:hypothetical protein